MTEQTVHFGPDQSLVGTVSIPPLASAPRRAVLLTNAGIISRVGPHRINVAVARLASCIGLIGFRFDMAGLGDSQRRDPDGTMLQQRLSDIRAAMDHVQHTWGPSRFAMVGFCSGADLAHLMALEDPRLDAIVMFDPYLYRTPRALLNYFLRQARRHGLSYGVRLAMSVLRHPLLPFEDPDSFDTAKQGRTVFPSRDEFAARLETLVARNVRILLVFSGSSPAMYNYPSQFRDAFRRYGFADRIESVFLADCDHMLTTSRAQASFQRLVSPWLERVRDTDCGAAC
ncbi:MAG: dienelactone hydrolase family protein [Pseudomonadota bacterium]|nr:dienelactone hydrolase family protein [Burkholderiaceae bacterium]MDQ3446757.1 dienelactone hydrolase family protein [Pseudomonadota bacterium]